MIQKLKDEEFSKVSGGWSVGTDSGGALFLNQQERQILCKNGYILRQNIGFTPGIGKTRSPFSLIHPKTGENLSLSKKALMKVQNLLGEADIPLDNMKFLRD